MSELTINLKATEKKHKKWSRDEEMPYKGGEVPKPGEIGEVFECYSYNAGSRKESGAVISVPIGSFVIDEVRKNLVITHSLNSGYMRCFQVTEFMVGIKRFIDKSRME